MRTFFFALSLCIATYCNALAPFKEVFSFKEITQELLSCDDNTLIIFDVDEVLITTKDQFMHENAASYYALLEKKALLNDPNHINQLSLAILFPERTLVEENIPWLIQTIQKKGIKTIALTSCPTGSAGKVASIDAWRINHLKSLGIDFSISFPTIPNFPLSTTGKWQAMYNSGILFSPGHNKGKILKEFFLLTGYLPSQILFFDDRVDNLADVCEEMASLKIPCKAIHYLGAQKFLKPLNEKALLYQLDHLINKEEWLNDDEVNHRMTMNEEVEKIKDKIINRGDLPYISVDKQLEFLDQLTEFEIGRSLIKTRVLTAETTHHIATHPEKKHPITNEFEKFILEKAPTAKATQERYQIFKKEIQKRLQNGSKLASIPSGVMGDLLELDYSNLNAIKLVGIDTDPKAHLKAKELAKTNHVPFTLSLHTQDAWDLDLENEFDLITSNGLAIYEPNDDRVIELYKIFKKALKPNGVLITSFLTPPPTPQSEGLWKMDQIDKQDALLQKILIVDILEAKWQAYRTEETLRRQLRSAGFNEIEIIYDSAHIFPTLIAK